jgi:hypothetical protein
LVNTHVHVTALVYARLYANYLLRGRGYFVDKQCCYLLTKYIFRRPDITEVLHGSALLFRTILVKVKVKFTLEQAMKAHRGIRAVALLFL